MSDEKTALTTKIVEAYLGGNTLAAADVPDLIRATYAALASVASPIPEPTEQQPFVPVKKSVTPDAIICLECGKKFSMMKRHLRTDHDISPDEYRAKWGLPATYPMVAPDYAAHRSALAVKIGLGHKRNTDATDAAAPIVAEKPIRGREKTVSAPESPAQSETTGRHQYPQSRWSKPTA